MKLHTETFRIRAGEVGPGGLLRLTALADIFQEVAGNNAIAVGYGTDALREQGLTWVLSRLRIAVTNLPRWCDEIVVSTWPSGIERLWAFREFRVERPDGEVLARGSSAWLILKIASKRPIRPPEFVERAAVGMPPREMASPTEEIDLPEGLEPGPSFRAGRYDLDVNGHANNVAILRWLLEALPEPPGVPFSALADFRGEALEGAVIVSRRSRGIVFLAREADGREVARLKTSAF